jgi:HEAT repeat protein
MLAGLMAGQEIDELFKRVLSSDYEDERAWESVRALRRIGTREVFVQAKGLCSSADPLNRARGVDIIAQLGKTFDHPHSFPEESYLFIASFVQHETDPRPLASALAALGHIDNPLAVPLITNFSSHPDREVRFNVAFALGCFPDDPVSVRTLLQLIQDKNEGVRDWATFGLGVLGNANSEEIREALLECLSDSSEDVREEAMVGLSKRRDQHVIPGLLTALANPNVSDRVIEAAYLILGMESEREGWAGIDYASALLTQFSG